MIKLARQSIKPERHKNFKRGMEQNELHFDNFETGRKNPSFASDFSKIFRCGNKTFHIHRGNSFEMLKIISRHIRRYDT